MQPVDSIVSYLKIKPISHGQIYTFQIAIPPSEVVEIPWEREEFLKNSLTQHGTNLIPLIVRRTEAYSEEEEYEVVFGFDVYLVAKALDIERLWVWVFDMTDEQAAATKEEMQQLLGNITVQPTINNQEIDIANLIDQKLKPIYSKLTQIISNTNNSTNPNNVDDKITKLENQVQLLLSTLTTLCEKIDKVIPPPPPPKLNLVTATDEEIRNLLEDIGMKKINIKAVLEAVNFWKKSSQGLTWKNLEESIPTTGQHKITNFGKETYQKLKTYVDIRTP